MEDILYSMAGGYMDDMIYQINNALRGVMMFLMIFPLINVYFGYKWNKILSKICFTLFVAVVLSIFGVIFPPLIFILFILGLIVGWNISEKMYYISIFIGYFITGFVITMSLGLIPMIMQGDINDGLGGMVIFGIFGGSLLGYLAVKFEKPVIVIVTSIGNYPVIYLGMYIMFLNGFMAFMTTTIIILTGFYYQCVSNGNVFGIGKKKVSEIINDISDKESISNIMNNVTEKTSDIVKGISKSEITKNVFNNQGMKIDIKNSKYREKLGDKVKYSSENEYYAKEIPLIITQVEILGIDEEENVGVKFGVQNTIKNKEIIGIYVEIKGIDLLGEVVEIIENEPILDLNINNNLVYIIDRIIKLKNKSVRRVEIKVNTIIYKDREVWRNDENIEFEEVEEGIELDLNMNLREIFKEEIEENMNMSSEVYKYKPMEYRDYWVCACGQINNEDEEGCVFCEIEREAIFSYVDIEELTKKYNEKLEKQKEEEQKIKEELERKEKERQLKDKIICSKCNSYSKKTDTFCGNCGNKL